jgi:hypothetical protein
MKSIYLIGIAVVIAACSSNPLRCTGALRPINKSVASARPSGPGGSTSANEPDVSATPAAPGNSAALPAEPRP